MTQNPNFTTLYILANSQSQPTHALILAKKLATLASQQGINAQVVTSQDLASLTADNSLLISVGEPVKSSPVNLSIEQETIAIAAADNPELALHEALNGQPQSAKAVQYSQPVFVSSPSSAQNSPTTTQSSSLQTDKPLRFVAITACPTGVAHTFMAADALKLGAERLGYQINVETQGSVGAKNILTEEQIANADYVILATDIEVNADRFVGKKIYRTSTGVALKQTDKAFVDAIAHAKVETASSGSTTPVASKNEKTGIYKHLMTGVSFMLPIVVAGGLLIAMSFVFGIEAFEVEGSLASVLMQTGKAAFTLMIPILSGYIAYSIADRAGLAAGLVGGLLASQLGAGFLGAIVSGFLAGYIARFLAQKLRLPQTMEALKPILIIPLISSLLIGLLMFYVVGQPVAAALHAMETFLTNLGTGNLVLLGLVLGAMMCVDMGGPINKAAYTFSVGLLTLATPNQFPIAAAMAGGMTPAIGMGIATWLARNKFTAEERNAGNAAFVLGLCFISEGAIPFAAKDPSRVIPSCVAGGAVTGALVGLFHTTVAAPHGGIFVLLIPNAINKPLMYIVAILVGSLVTGALYAVLKPKTIDNQPKPVLQTA